MNKIIGLLTYLLSYIIPIDKKLLIFVSQVDYADNSYAIYLYMMRNNYHLSYKMLWLVDDVNRTKLVITEDLNKFSLNSTKVKCIKRKSLLAIYYTFRAKFIFNTSGLFNKIRFHQKKRINIWHGMPLKKIWSDDNISLGDYTIATSELFVPLMSKALLIPKENIFLIGQPRNDLMFESQLFNFPFLNNSNTVGMFAPTFRKTVNGEYSEGVYNEHSISIIKYSQLTIFNEELRKRSITLIIKIHPMDILQTVDIENYSNIIILKNTTFHNRLLYPLLGKCDFLITDYSSIAVDYEILKRPMAFIIDDIENYKSTRGLIIDKLPGTLIKDYNELVSFLDRINDKSAHIYDNQDKFNKFRDNESTIRLLKSLSIKTNLN